MTTEQVIEQAIWDHCRDTKWLMMLMWADPVKVKALAQAIAVKLEEAIWRRTDCTCDSDPLGRCVVHGILSREAVK